MTTVQIASSILQITGVGLCISVLICMFVVGRCKTAPDKLYIAALLSNIFAIVFDFLAVANEAYLTAFTPFGIRLFNFLSFACNFLLIDFFFAYFSNYLAERTFVYPVPKMIIHFATVVLLLLLLVNTEIPLFYYFDPGYTRGPLFWLTQATAAFSLLAASSMIILHRKVLETYEKVAMWTYTLIPLAGVVFQYLFYGLAITSFANSLSALAIFVYLQLVRDRELAQKDRELIVNQMNITLSQIQPHFLNNALNTVQYLCETDPEVAGEVVGKLSKYIRVNMDSLSQKSPIPFEDDLEHLKNYLSIERIRFPDICFEYDIKVKDFSVPPLTLQPMVENAIKHGVRQLEKGGKIKIATYRTRTDNVIVVEDNGNGFDPNQKKNDNRSHVGLSNTGNRLKLMCRGTLTVDTKIGYGTKIIISIPIEHGEKHENISG